MSETRSLHRKLAQVMYEAERIPKNGKAPKEMGGYPFVQVGDAADFIRKALAEKVVTMIPTAVRVVGQVDRPTKSGGSMTTVDLIVTWTLTDGESGETATIESFGAGADGGDKYSGKASTSAMKYALLSGFLLSTGEDSELGGAPERPVKPAAGTNGSLIGIAKKGSGQFSKAELRQEADKGYAIGFRLQAREGDKGGTNVEAFGPLAEALATVIDEWLDKPVTCWGRFEDREYPLKSGAVQKYQVLVLSRLMSPTFTLPATSAGVPPDSENVTDSGGAESAAEPSAAIKGSASPEASDEEAGATKTGAGAVGSGPAPAPDELDALPLFEQDPAA